MRRHRRVLVQAPTGFGKSVVIAHMVASAQVACPPVWVAAHRREILDQLSRVLWACDVGHSWVLGRRAKNNLASVQLGSIQSLWNRRTQLRRPSLLVVDEAHHCTSPTYRRLLAHVGSAWVIGLTATPMRLDGQPLGDIFGELVLGPSTAELIQMGRLARYRVFGAAPPDDTREGMKRRAGDFARGAQEDWLADKRILGDGPKHYMKWVYPGSSLVFCPTRRVAREARDRFRRAGIPSEYVGGDTPAADRMARVRGLKTGHVKVVTSVDLFSEGLDCPGLAAVQLMRPTESLALYLQQVGRALRVEDGKQEALILDHVKNVWRHGLPDAQREWVLEKGGSRKRGSTPVASVSYCAECFAVFRSGVPRCPACGHAVTVGRKVEEDREATLVEIDPAVQRVKRRAEERSARTLDDLVRLAQQRGYRRGWAAHRFAARHGIELDAQLRAQEGALWKHSA